MAVDNLVDSAQLDADLTSVAVAIRTKGGTSASLAFPAEFVSAIAAIPTGGGGGWTTDGIASNTEPNGSLQITVQDIRNYAFYNCTRITALDLTNAIYVRSNSFQGCTGVTLIHAPKLQTIETGGFFYTKPTVMCFPALVTLQANGLRGLNGDASTTVVDLGKVQALNSNCLSDRTALKTLILRRKSAITTLSNVNVFDRTPYANGRDGGTIYVPAALIDTYKAATNWSTVNGYGTITWAQIEGSIYETQYADGTPIT